MVRAYGSTDPVNSYLPTPNSQLPSEANVWGFGGRGWELEVGRLGVACPSARQTIPGAEDLAQKPLVFFVNLDTL